MVVADRTENGTAAAAPVAEQPKEKKEKDGEGPCGLPGKCDIM